MVRTLCVLCSGSRLSTEIPQATWSVQLKKKKNCTPESCELFYLGQNENFGPGDSISDSSQKLLQRAREESQYICDFSEGVPAVKHIFWQKLAVSWASPVAQVVKKLPTMQKTWILSLGEEDPLEKRMATHSSILAWRIPLTEEPSGLQSTGLQRSHT